MMLFPDTRTLGTLAAVPGGVLTGLAFATPTFAWACTVDDNGGSFASFQRFVIVPMFLFSGTFFSVSLLPVWLQVVAWFTPLFHGVSLCRGLALGGMPVWQMACTPPSSPPSWWPASSSPAGPSPAGSTREPPRWP